MKVDVTTLDGKKMTGSAARTPVGAALRIAPAFVATHLDDGSGVETTIEAHYSAEKGRYVLSRVANRGVGDDYDEDRLRTISAQAILRAAVPHCVTVRLDDGPDERWFTIADLTTDDGRIIPPWMVTEVVKRGMKEERWDVVEILYGAAALAGLPPVKLIASELSIPERTASDWIKSSRAAGRLVGMTSTVGRPAGG